MLTLLFQKKHRNFFRLWVAQLISQIGDRIHQFALIALIAERTPGSTMALAKIMAFTILPVFIIQPFAGVFVDRWNRRTTLFICDILRGLLVLSIAAYFLKLASMVPIYIIVFLTFSLSRFFVPAKMSIIPDLVHPENLLKANSLITTSGMIAFAFGFAFGGFIIESYGSRNGFFIDATTFFISAAFLYSMDLRLKLRDYPKDILEHSKDFKQKFKTSIWTEMKEGFQYIFKHKEFRFLINTFFTLFMSIGAIYIVIIVFVQESFHSITKDLGILAVFLCFGLFLGVILYGKWGKSLSWHRTIFLCLICGGLMLIIFAVVVHHYPLLWIAIILAFCLGVVIGPIFIAANTITHVISDEAMRGKVFSALEIVIHLGFIIAMFVSSWASEYIAKVWILVTVGCICILVGVLGALQRDDKFDFSVK